MTNQPWPERGIKGAKYLVAGGFLIGANSAALDLARGNDLALAAVNLLCGVVGPVFMVAGLYLIGTRNRKPKVKADE